MKTLLFILFVILVGCASVPIEELSDLTPADCRAYGVDVADDAPITGTIVRSELGLTGTLYRECVDGRSVAGSVAGCTKAATPVEQGWLADDHRYEIWYSDSKCVPEHEACHAIYERGQHTTKYFVRMAQGDRSAACPLGQG